MCCLACERFFGIVHVSDTTTLTLKNEICIVLSNHNLEIQNIRGQGYDGASNMQGEWNGLQAFILCDCHLSICILIGTRYSFKRNFPTFKIFKKLTYIVNVVVLYASDMIN